MSYSQSYYHIVFRTSHSKRTIEERHERDLYLYIYAYCKNKEVKLWRINSMPDHIHMLVSLPPDMAVATFVRETKKTAGNYIKQHRKEFPMFDGWAEGYCSITYSLAERDAVIRYIAGQKEHHHHKSLADEMQSILRDSGLEYNPQFFKRDWAE